MIVTDDQIVSLHTYRGVQLYQFTPPDTEKLVWSREAGQVSRCDTTVASTVELARVPDVVPWLHWVSVWDAYGAELYWTGPVLKTVTDRRSMTVYARDIGALMTRTRTPITKRWEVTDPTRIAAELWAAMIQHHNVRATPHIRPDPRGDRYDFHATADAEMLNTTIEQLVKLGLRWTVVAGTPILGPAPVNPITALGEHDFIDAGVTVTRDGTRTANDVLLRSKDDAVRAGRPLAGLGLQTIVNVDSLSGVSNADRAARQYLRRTSQIRDAITLDPNARLHPDAPLTAAQLIPSNRYTLEAHGLLTLMELHSVEVSCTSGGTDVAVGLESVTDPDTDEPPELDKLDNQAGG